MDQDVSKFDSYSKTFAEKVSDSFFSANQVVSSENILSVTTLDQVNLFVAKNLFERWREEIHKLKSPYFNYESEQVKKGLGEFMNILSRNISIRKEFFMPMLEKAVWETLILMDAPLEYFKRTFSGKQFRISELKEYEKYYKLHRNFWPAFFVKFPFEKTEIKGEELIAFFENYIRTSPLPAEEREKYVQAFSSILPFPVAQKQPQPADPAASSFFQEIEKGLEEPFARPASIPFEQKPAEQKPAEQKPVEQKPVEQRPVEQKPAGQEKPVMNRSEVKPEVSGTLNEKFAGSQLTLHDVLRKSSEGTIADKIGKSRIENIRAAISLSQKFLFIQALFGGSGSDYEAALTGMDNCRNLEEAMTFLNTHYIGKYKWDPNALEVSELMEILGRRFQSA